MNETRKLLRWLELIAAVAALVAWVIAAAISIPSIEPTLEGLERTADLAVALQRQGYWNAVAAALTAAALACAIVAEWVKVTSNRVSKNPKSQSPPISTRRAIFTCRGHVAARYAIASDLSQATVSTL